MTATFEIVCKITSRQIFCSLGTETKINTFRKEQIRAKRQTSLIQLNEADLLGRAIDVNDGVQRARAVGDLPAARPLVLSVDNKMHVSKLRSARNIDQAHPGALVRGTGTSGHDWRRQQHAHFHRAFGCENCVSPDT